MSRKALRVFAVCVVVLLALAGGAVGTSAQYAQRKPGEAAEKSPLTGHLIKTGLYMFSGAGNSLLRLSANGLIVVDGQTPGNYEALAAHIDKISDQDVRVAINTDHHAERTGNNAKFIAEGAQVLAHANVARHLTSAGSADGKTALPTRTYDRDFAMSLGGIEVKLMHFGNAHTDGDTVVYFPNLKVVAVGDLFASTPDPDFADGGSLVGWGPVLAEVLKLDFDVVVPGAGPAVGRSDLEAFKARLETLVSRATGLVKKGVSKTQLMAQLKTDDLGWRFTFTGDRLDRFYAELSRPR